MENENIKKEITFKLRDCQRKLDDITFENEIMKNREIKYKDELESINKLNINELSSIESKYKNNY